MSKELKERVAELEAIADAHTDCLTDLYSMVGLKEEVVYVYPVDYQRPKTVSTWSVTL